MEAFLGGITEAISDRCYHAWSLCLYVHMSVTASVTLVHPAKATGQNETLTVVLRVRTILVLGYWVLGDIGRIVSYRYWPNIFCGLDTQYDIICACVPPRRRASGTHYLEHQLPTSDAADVNVRGDGGGVGVDSGSASQSGLQA